MEHSQDITAWTALFLGLYALAAGFGELRAPGGWSRMLGEFEANHALRFLTGVFCIFAGGVIFLANPWVAAEHLGGQSGDLLAILINIIGGLMAVEGMFILAAGDRIIAFARKLMGSVSKGWAGFSCLIGAALLLAAISRIQTV